MMVAPHARYSGAAAMPWKLPWDARTATTPTSNALVTAPAPAKRASGVCATNRPASVASRIVHVVDDSIVDTGRRAASQAAPAAASSASPSQTSTRSGEVGSEGCAAAKGRSALDFARVQRLKAGARRATENRTATHAE